MQACSMHHNFIVYPINEPSFNVLFNKGFTAAMKTTMDEYATNIEVKVTVDWLQFTYQCCGAFNYTDWFTLPWMDTEYLMSNYKDYHERQVNWSLCEINIWSYMKISS
jgi:hypothetical protein